MKADIVIERRPRKYRDVDFDIHYTKDRWLASTTDRQFASWGLYRWSALRNLKKKIRAAQVRTIDV